ncbi:MAG: hypothetical protein U1E65_24760 [Myxococcota bacterium]
MSAGDRRSGTPEPTVAECVEAGLYFFARDDFNQARKWWEQALARDPDNARVHECLRILARTAPRPQSDAPPSDEEGMETLSDAAGVTRRDSFDIVEFSEPPAVAEGPPTPPTPLPAIGPSWGSTERTFTPRISAIPPPRVPPPALDEWSIPSRPPQTPAALEEWSRPSVLPGAPPVQAPLTRSSAPAAPEAAGPWNPGAQLEIDGGMSIDGPYDEMLGNPADTRTPAFGAMEQDPLDALEAEIDRGTRGALDADWDAAMRPFLSADVTSPLTPPDAKRGPSEDLARRVPGGAPFSSPPFSSPPFSAPPFSAPPFSAPPFTAPPLGPTDRRPSLGEPAPLPDLDLTDAFAARPPIVRGSAAPDDIIRPADALPTDVGVPFRPVDVAPEDIILPSGKHLDAVQRYSSPALPDATAISGIPIPPLFDGPEDHDDGLPPARTFQTSNLGRGAIKDEPSPEELMGEGPAGGDPLDIVIEEPEEYLGSGDASTDAMVDDALGEVATYSLGAFTDTSDDDAGEAPPGETPWDFGPAETSAVTLSEASDVDAVAELTPAPVLDREPLFHLASSGGGSGDMPEEIEVEIDMPDPIRELEAEVEKRTHRPRTSSPDDPRALLVSARDRLNLHDFDGALALLERIPSDDPAFLEAQDMLSETRVRLEQIYGGKLGSLEAAPKVLLSGEELIWLNLNHRAGFILSQVDGNVSYEDLISLSGMPRLDTLRILCTLLQEGVIGTD